MEALCSGNDHFRLNFRFFCRHFNTSQFLAYSPLYSQVQQHQTIRYDSFPLTESLDSRLGECSLFGCTVLECIWDNMTWVRPAAFVDVHTENYYQKSGTQVSLTVSPIVEFFLLELGNTSHLTLYCLAWIAHRSEVNHTTQISLTVAHSGDSYQQ